MSVEPETYPGTQAYVNKLDIRDAQILAEAEASFTWARTEEYRDSPSPTTFDFLHLKYIHHHLFQDLYHWAGERRSYDMKKENCIFTPADDIEHYADKVYAQLAEEGYLQGLEDNTFVERLAYYHDQSPASLSGRERPYPATIHRRLGGRELHGHRLGRRASVRDCGNGYMHLRG